ncbi:STAS domain-containing protein [Candidatus Magnetominusculus dajiuhuensis]|uniref:STAS domain-containing protein n=1 Tax=Candidatus Magnetominusculus dajiuhuensis TaxID=3137712 RepID=UPI003B437F15
MLEPSFNKEQNRGVLSLKGDITIEDAASLKELLLLHTGDVDDLLINVSDVTEVHLSWFQLICSAHRYSAKMKKKLSLCGEIPENIRTMAVKAGFKRHKGCVFDTCESCIWLWN